VGNPRRELLPHLRILGGRQILQTCRLGQLAHLATREGDVRVDLVEDPLALGQCGIGLVRETRELLVGEVIVVPR
jgi:hypothetical protein